MAPTAIKQSAAPSVEEGINAVLSNAQQSIRRSYQEYEQRVRKAPTSAVLIAAATGYCLHRLPVRSLLVAQVRLFCALAPPALFAFGAAKVYEFLQRQAPPANQGRL